MTKYTITDIIKSLADRPKLTASELKAKFDKANTDIGNFINNTLIPEVETALSGKSDSSHTHEKAEVGLENIDNTADIDKPVSNAVQSALDLKVDKAVGKELSDNNYTDEEKDNVSSNTAARHTHLNKTILDNISIHKVTRWDSTAEALDSKANKDSLSAVATSGSYNDLTDIPILVYKSDIDVLSDLDTYTFHGFPKDARCAIFKGRVNSVGGSYLMILEMTDNYDAQMVIYSEPNLENNELIHKLLYRTNTGDIWSDWSEYLTSDDMVDELGSTDKKKPLSANMGNYIKGIIDSQGTDITNLTESKADKTSLANVATSGNYNDLINKPIRYVVSTDRNNPLTLQGMDAGLCVLHGYFVPYQGSEEVSYYAYSLAHIKRISMTTSFLIFSVYNQGIEAILVSDDNDYTKRTVSFLELENINNKVLAIDDSSDDTHYPSAKAVYNALSEKADSEIWDTILNVTLEDDYLSYEIDNSLYPYLPNIKDFYIEIIVPKVATVQSGRLGIRLGNVVVCGFASWNHQNYVMKGYVYSKVYGDIRHTVSIGGGANVAIDLDNYSQLYQGGSSFSKITIETMTAGSVIPSGTQIIIKGCR